MHVLSRKAFFPQVVGLLAVVTPLVMLPAGPVLAAGPTAAVCEYVRHDTADPGFGRTPSQGRGAGSGELRCVGQVGGRELSAEPGTFTFDYGYGTGAVSGAQGDTCIYGSGDGIVSVVLPLADGETLALEGPANFVFAGLAGEVDGKLGDATFVAVEEFALEPDHLEENCAMNPIVHFIAVGQVVVTQP